ncbi:hypothetical protein [Amycolatopsis sp. NPDC051128]|uniref:hypothetical protein n=1 Tax=Amycolatopsis sp. NPDC051128 TaxID=3155412 RepID=UPI003446A7DC
MRMHLPISLALKLAAALLLTGLVGGLCLGSAWPATADPTAGTEGVVSLAAR